MGLCPIPRSGKTDKKFNVGFYNLCDLPEKKIERGKRRLQRMNQKTQYHHGGRGQTDGRRSPSRLNEVRRKGERHRTEDPPATLKPKKPQSVCGRF